MSEYSIVYIILAVFLLLYSLCNRLDLVCIASVCYIVYSMYCIPGIGISGLYRPNLSSTLYYSVYAQLIIIIIFVVYFRHVMKRKAAIANKQKMTGYSDVNRGGSTRLLKKAFELYTLIIVIFSVTNIASIGWNSFSDGKSVVWEQTNIWYLISLYGAWPSFAYGIHTNNKKVWIPSLLVELTIFFAGSRAFTATIIIIFLCEKGTILWEKRKSYVKIYILGAIGVLFLLLYRMVDTFIMAGDISGAINTLSNPQTWLTALEFNEPRVIIANYDYSITSGIQLPIGDVIYRLIDFIPGLTKIFNIKLEYPEYYSTWLMEQVHGSAGVGGSIWGESYAMMGFIGIIIFTLIWLAFINLCNKHLDYHTSYSYFIVALGIYLAWYINRLDFNRVGQSCKVMLFCFLMWALIYLIMGGIIRIGKFGFRIRLKG